MDEGRGWGLLIAISNKVVSGKQVTDMHSLNS